MDVSLLVINEAPKRGAHRERVLLAGFFSVKRHWEKTDGTAIFPNGAVPVTTGRPTGARVLRKYAALKFRGQNKKYSRANGGERVIWTQNRGGRALRSTVGGGM